MSEPELDTKIKSETVTATFVVAEPVTVAEKDASPSVDDPESGRPRKTASERLKEADKKTVLFVGYVFWAIILGAGIATAVVLLTRGGGDDKKVTSFVEPTSTPSAAPSYAACSHEKIMRELELFVGDDMKYCTERSVNDGDDDRGLLTAYECIIGGDGCIEGAPGYIDYRYRTSNDFNFPETFYAWSLGDDFDEIEFEFTQNGEPCNFYQKDELFEKILAAAAIPCSHTQITEKLHSSFGKTNCSTETSTGGYLMGCEVTTKPGTKARADYSFSTIDGRFQPEAITMTYLEEGEDDFVSTSQLSGDCTFDNTLSTFEDIAGTKCPDSPYNWDEPCKTFPQDLTCQPSSTFTYTCCNTCINQPWLLTVNIEI